VRDSEVSRAGRWRAPTGRGRMAIIAVCGGLGLLAAACSSAAGPGHGSTPGHAPRSRQAVSSAQISITPRNGTTNAKPYRGVTVTVAHGRLRTVSVSSGGASVAGTLSQNGTTWHTRWALHTSTRYTVTATAVTSGGKAVTATSTFRTVTPSATDTASTLLGDQTYGVGMPIMIGFSTPVSKSHQAQVERSIVIKSSKPVVGAWYWDNEGGCGEPQCIYFRTQNYWPQHTKVSFDAHLNGLEAAPGVYFTANLSQSFTIGNSLIAEVSYTGHHTRIYYKNKLFAVWPDSAGTTTGGAETETANGTYLSIEKGNPVLMSGPGYTNVPVYYSVRFTWSGNYMHSAPWSVGEQGFINVSHGCVNLSPADAQWYYDHSVPGDPITVYGSPLEGRWDDGWTQWFLSWNQLLRGSATHEAVEAGPSGSVFVSPSSVTSQPRHSVLHGPRDGNYLAA
jgi:lipoprotein-anchoring transpeptidase ErfK/SrfK